MLHIVNVSCDTEWEMEPPVSFPEILYRHKNYLQLQYLSLLYAEGAILATHPYPDSRVYTYDDVFPKAPLDVWGHAPSLADWAKQHDVPYVHPPFALVKELTSKEFFYRKGFMPYAVLLWNWADLEAWLHPPFPKVLKSCFGFAGRGHLVLHQKTHQRLHTFCETAWRRGLPLIAEPWFAKHCDFSTQWHVGDQVEYLGMCTFETNRANSVKTLTFPADTLSCDLTPQRTLLEEIKAKGYFGHVGFDAFIDAQGEVHLTEINPRKTLGFVALKLFEKYQRPVHLAFQQAGPGLLPEALGDIRFPLQLTLQLI